ncbi:MAG: ATP-dependent DNA ligase, partial [Weeksellaceae bacterium]
LQGRVSPQYIPLNFGMAEKMVLKAVSQMFQIDADVLLKRFQKTGDIGTIVQEIKADQPSLLTKELSVQQVFDALVDMAKSSGAGSQDKKLQQLAHLIAELDPLSARYVSRIPVGALRLGFSDMTILDGLSWMILGDKTAKTQLQRAYLVRPDLGHIAYVVKHAGLDKVAEITPEVFTPILMMRAERLSSGEEIVDKIGECAVESKYDGFRLQIHKKGKEVRMYTRGLEDATHMYPDVVEGVLKQIKADTIIFEGEAIGFDPASQTFLPFQETVQRKRKYGVEEKAKEMPLKLFAFELLYLNDASLLIEPYVLRQTELAKAIKVTGDVAIDTLIPAGHTVVKDAKHLELLFDDAITKGLEGIIAKKLDGIYQPGARGWNWIKFKRSYSSKIDDTIDCVVMGYDVGKGKRADFGIGAFLVGVYDATQDKYVTVAKIGTGLTDDEWRELQKRLHKLHSTHLPAMYEVDKMMTCDLWATPEIVVEIKADELTRSTIHTAGRVMKASKSGSTFDVEEPGYALRFPRLQRFRDDKQPQDATTLKEVQKMFKAQRS